MVSLYSLVIFLSIGISSFLSGNNMYKPLAEKTTQCENIDSIFNQLVSSKVDTVFLYEEQNFISGFKGLIIWSEAGTLKGIKLIHDEQGEFKKKETIQNLKVLTPIFYKYFDGIGRIEALQKSKIETMHDFNIRVKSVTNGKFKEVLFTDAQRFNNPALIAVISRLCQEAITTDFLIFLHCSPVLLSLPAIKN